MVQIHINFPLAFPGKNITYFNGPDKLNYMKNPRVFTYLILLNYTILTISNNIVAVRFEPSTYIDGSNKLTSNQEVLSM